MPDPTLELVDLHKRYGSVVAVAGVSLTVPPATIFGLLGPNGAGKTTTIRMIMDIIGPDRGEVRLFGRRRGRKDLERVGYLPEERGLYRRMTVEEQLLFLGELRGVRKAEARPRIARWLERVELADRASAKVEELSKGMQQKIQLVATLLHEPDLLILDEPFSGLDPINQVLFKEVLADYKASGRTILFSTHVMEQAEKLCDHIGLIARGRTILSGELAALKRGLGGGAYRLEIAGDPAPLGAIPSVTEVMADGGRVRLLTDGSRGSAALLKDVVEVVEVLDFRSEEPDLEEIFVKAVRDAEAQGELPPPRETEVA